MVSHHDGARTAVQMLGGDFGVDGTLVTDYKMLAAPQFVSVQRVKPATRRGVAPTLPRKPPAQLPLSLTAFQPRTIPFHHIGRRASEHPIGPGKSGIAQVPTRSLKVAAGLHLGTVRTSFRNRTSAHGGQGGRGREILLSVHSHMLQPACGFKLANDGHDCIKRRCRPLGQDFNLSNVKLAVAQMKL